MSLDLNLPQQEAVRHTGTPLLVLAGAGSGKTRVITQKIAYLIGERGMPARHIAAVTFTNKAAREMKARVGRLLGQTPEGLRISTFHALGLDIIRREARHLGLRPGFSIYDNQDSANLIRDLMCRSFGDDGKQAERTQWRISAWKNDFLQPEQVLLEDKSDAISAAAMRVYADYNRHLRTCNAVDFDDLIMLPVLLFREQPEILDKWRSRIRYLLIDEYQDTNATQYELVRALVGERQGLTVVGDDDQSIYAWRGACPENLARLQTDFPDLRVIKLEQNYRSMGRILKAANALIGNNPHVYEKRLWSDLGYGDPIRVIRTANEEDEAERIVAELLHHRFQKGSRFGDYAILYRGNHQSRLFEKQLALHNVPYYLSGGTSFFAYSEIKDIMAYLRLVTNPEDDNAFLRIVNTPRREIGPTSVEALVRFAASRHSHLLNACFDNAIHSELKTRAVNSIQAFANWVVDMSQRVAAGESVEVVRDIIRDIGYETWLIDNCKEREDAERRMGNVNDLVEWISRLSREQKEGGLGEVIRRLTLLDMLDRDDDNARDQVSLMTLHAAKGLEFDCVFLVGFEENLLPHRASIEEGNIEEERRLAYVGLTRARRELTLSFAARRKRHGEIVECEPSRFLDELPADDLDWSGRDNNLSDEEKKARGRGHLAGLRKLLATE